MSPVPSRAKKCTRCSGKGYVRQSGGKVMCPKCSASGREHPPPLPDVVEVQDGVYRRDGEQPKTERGCAPSDVH